MTLEAHLDRLGVGAAIRERVLRMNPQPKEGTLLRGMHFKRGSRHWRLMTGAVGKGEFLARFGRDAWERLPSACMIKDGRRLYVRYECVADRDWERHAA